ncbi:MAG: molybdopterin-dependent oxidoreductase [Candidatus Anammoxibacter sp.]
MLKRFYHPERILKPRIKKDGKWKEASWDSALDLITEKLNEYKDKYGSLSTLFCSYHAGTGILKGVMSNIASGACFGGVTTVSGGMSMEAAITARVADFGNVLPNLDIPESKNIIIWGKDAVVTNPHLVPLLKDVQKKGTKLYVIDPLNNQTAKLADKHYQVRPGSDGLLAIGIAKVILEQGKADKKETDLSIEDIQEPAALYSDKKPTGTWFCPGPQYSDKGESNIRLMDAPRPQCPAMLLFKGGGCQFGINGAIAFDLSITDQFVAKESGVITLPLLGSQMSKTDNPPLKFAWIAAHNPMVLTCNSSKVRSAFDSLEFRVPVDTFMTKASESADVFSPTTTYLEESDVSPTSTSKSHNLHDYNWLRLLLVNFRHYIFELLENSK